MNKIYLEKMLSVINRMETLKTELEELNGEIEICKSNIDKTVDFPEVKVHNVKNSRYPLKYSMSEMNGYIGMKKDVEYLLSRSEEVDEDITFNVGEVLISTTTIKVSKVNKKVFLDQAGFYEKYGIGEAFLVVDKLNEQNYVITRIRNNYHEKWTSVGPVFHVTKPQLALMMEKNSERAIEIAREVNCWHKIELNISGLDSNKYCDYLSQIKFFTNKCKDRYKSEYNYDYGYAHDFVKFETTADEDFGIVVTIYLEGRAYTEYQSIVARFGDVPTERKRSNKNSKDSIKIGFHKRPGTDIYDYDADISYFISGNYPKDVFTMNKPMIHLIEVTNLIKSPKAVI